MKPIETFDEREWLTPKELAGIFGRTEDSVYRWRRELIPDVHPKLGHRLIRYCGIRRILLHPDVVGLLEEKFSRAHD